MSNLRTFPEGPLEAANILLSNVCGANFDHQPKLGIFDLPQEDGPSHLSYYDCAHATLYIHSNLVEPPPHILREGDDEALEQTEAQQKHRLAWQASRAKQIKQALLLFQTCQAVIWCHEATDIAALKSYTALLQRAKDVLPQASSDSSSLLLRSPSQSAHEACPNLILAIGTPAWRLGQEKGTADHENALGALVSSTEHTRCLFSLKPNSTFWVPPVRSYLIAVMDAALNSFDTPIKLPLPEQEPYARIRAALALKPVQPGNKPVEGFKEIAKSFRRAENLIFGISKEAPEGRNPQGAATKLIERECLTFRYLIEASCQLALQKAKALYRDSLPIRYTQAVHENRVRLALEYFTRHAKGFTQTDWKLRLEKECKEFWQQGRRACSAISLSGNSCTLPPHRLPTEPATPRTEAIKDPAGLAERLRDMADAQLASSPEEQLVRCHHSSGVFHQLVDLSGSARKSFADPFSIEDANTARHRQDGQQNTTYHSLKVTYEHSGTLQETTMEACVTTTIIPHARQKEIWKQFQAGCNSLHALHLPRQPDRSESHAKGTGEELGNVAPLEQAKLDAEFPTLSAAIEKSTEKRVARKGSAHAGKEASPAEEAKLRYIQSIKEGWPGSDWQNEESPKETAGKTSRPRGGRLGNARRGRHAKTDNQTPAPIFQAGFEYETLQGQRIFLGSQHLQSQASPDSKIPELSRLLSNEVPLFLDVPSLLGAMVTGSQPASLSNLLKKPLSRDADKEGQNKNEQAQLMRIWISPPDGPVNFLFNPRIQIKVNEITLRFELEKEVEISNGELNSICLPLVYSCPGNWIESSKETLEPMQSEVDAKESWTALSGLLLKQSREGSLKSLSIQPM